MRTLLTMLIAAACLAAAPSKAVLLEGSGPWADEAWQRTARAFRGLLGEAGYRVKTADPAKLELSGAALVAAPSLERLPLAAFRAIAAFTAAGGDLLATGGEPFREPLYPDGRNGWISAAEALASVKPEKIILEPGMIRALQRTSDRFQPAPFFHFDVPGPQGWFNTLAVRIPALSVWEMLETVPFAASPFEAGQDLTIVTVRGTPGQALAVQWRQADGNEWTAQVPLTAEWRTHALRPSDFRKESALIATRGRFQALSYSPMGGKAFDPAAARVLRFGLSTAFGSKPGAAEYAIGPVGIGSTPALLAGTFTPPVLETISPWYKQYAATREGHAVRIPIARPRGLTSTPEPDGRYRVAGSLTNPAATRYFSSSGAVLLWLPWPELQGAARAELLELLRGARAGVGLLNSGAQSVLLLPEEPVAFGARVLNASPDAASVTVRWQVRSGGKTLLAREASVPVAAGETREVHAESEQPLPPGEYRVETTLVAGGAACDRGDSYLRVFDPAVKRSQDRRIRVSGGHFTVGGKRILLYGANFWPRYFTALEIKRSESGWITPLSYDPDIVEADLEQFAALGMNVVSIANGNPANARPLMDFLERCRRHGIWVNLYTAAASDLRLNAQRSADLIHAAHLAGNDTLFAYDLAWEPKVGAAATRRKLDPEWRDWILEQYGSFAAAEQAWKIPAPRDEKGNITNPTDAQYRSDGPHRILLAAYRRFLDDHVSRRYGHIIRYLRTLDPDTLMGVRTGFGGTGTNFNNELGGYDLASGAAHLDFVSPEGYSLPPDFEKARGTGFITAYGRYAGNGKPVFWSEFGAMVGRNGGTPETHRDQARLHETMMRVIEDSDADGAAAWWWPGGWRVVESSDYGLLNPDGTPREAAKTLAAWGSKLNRQPPGRGETETIAIDRDRDARGLLGLWLHHEQAYVEARARGRAVRLATAGTGTTTATMPAEQVGNVPYRGVGPLKYANAEIAGIRVNGDAVENSAEIPVKPSTTYELTVTLLNTGEAAWLPDCVFRVGDQELRLGVEVPRFGRAVVGPFRITVKDAPLEITGRMHVPARGGVGEALHLRLKP